MCATDHDHPAAPLVVAPARIADEPVEEPLNLSPVDDVSVTILMDNVSDMLLLDDGPAKRPPLGEGARRPVGTLEEGESVDAFVAEHGFATLVTVTKGATQHRILFDSGLSPDGMVENMRRLDLDPKDVGAVVMSHGHFDHTTGLDGFIRAVGGSTNLPVVIHPEFWTHRRITIPGRDPIELPTTSRRALEDAGFDVIERPEPSFLLDQSVLVTGEVDRTTDFETGFVLHQARRNGEWEPDPLILDDQALVVNVRDRGLVVITGCGHAGAVNIARYARRLTGVEHVHALMGGFHLSGPLFEPVIPPTIAALAELAPDHVVPAHCTGWRAVHGIAAALPDAFIQSSVGTRFEFGAVPAAA